MCLIVRKGTPIQVAEEDIVCYKEMYVVDKIIVSMHRRFEYKLGVRYDTKFTHINASRNFDRTWFFPSSKSKDYYFSLPYRTAYQDGFHSFLDINDSEYSPNVECIIPKGSRYVCDETGLVCSESIIITKIL